MELLIDPCPECRQLKCRNCTGTTLGTDDKMHPCPCKENEHRGLF